MTSETLAQLIRARRTALAIGPVQLARKAGVNMAVVGALEGGDVRHVSVAELLKVMDCLDLHIHELSPAGSVEASPPVSAEMLKPIPANLRIRLAQSSDAEALTALLAASGMSGEDATRLLQDTAVRCHTGWLGPELAGMIAVQGRDVTLWCVRPEWQGRGLGRKLWLHLKAQAIASGQRELPRLPGDDQD